MGERIHRDEGTWREIFARQEASGLLVSEFCRQESINPGVFRRWRSRLNGGAKPRGKTAAGPAKRAAPFIDMGELATDRSGLEVRLELAPGVVLSIARG